MDKTNVEVSAKTIDEAIVAGCAELSVGMDEVDFEIIDQGGVFRNMKVRVSLKNVPKEKAEKEEKVKEPPVAAEAADNANKEEPAPAEESSHEVVDGHADEFVIEAKARQPRVRTPRPERPVTEFDPNAPKFVKSLEFATKLFELLGEGLTITTEHNDREFIISIHGEDVSRLIGKEGHTMAALNTIVASVAINNSNGEGRRVIVDIENYREKRQQTLIELGKRKAEWVKESGKTVKLEPMPARERLIIHTALQDMEGIQTHSQGEEPNRYLIISPSAR
jgi:spoIIIJ-associated protein